MKKRIYTCTLLHLIGFIFAFTFQSCDKGVDENLKFGKNDISIARYISNNSDQLGDFLALAQQGGYAGILNVYGSYTAFVFTNKALETYKKEKGITAFTHEQAKRLIQYHLLKSAVTTETMGNGGLTPTTFGDDYLEVSFQGANDLMVNRISKITQRNEKLTNGVLHIIDTVLEPKDISVRDHIFSMPQYSIFKAAWLESGFDAVYNKQIVPTSFFLVSNDVYKAAGINNLEELKHQPFINNNADALLNYVAYHALSGMRFLNGIESGNYSTLAKELLSFKAENVYKINKRVENNIEQYITILPTQSNLQAKNGVIHSLNKLMIPQNPKAEYFYFDFCEVPEIMAQSWYRKGSPNDQDITNMTFETMNFYISGAKLTYFQSSDVNDQKYFFNKDAFVPQGGSWWVEFTLPKIVSGKYLVRMVFKSGSTRAVVQLYWNGEKLGDPLNMRTPALTSNDIQNAGSWWRKTVATLELTETKSNLLKLSTILDGQGNMDGIEFIPID